MTRDIALHILAAAAVMAVLLFGGPWGAAVANAFFWIERERAQTVEDRPERRPVLDWSMNKNLEWIWPAVVGFAIAGAIA